jgi:hypothetical protein
MLVEAGMEEAVAGVMSRVVAWFDTYLQPAE